MIVYLAQHGSSLYIGVKKDSEWSTFWSVDVDMPLESILGLLVRIQNWGDMDRRIPEHNYWGGSVDQLTMIGVHDGGALILHRDRMSTRTKIRLKL